MPADRPGRGTRRHQPRWQPAAWLHPLADLQEGPQSRKGHAQRPEPRIRRQEPSLHIADARRYTARPQEDRSSPFPPILAAPPNEARDKDQSAPPRPSARSRLGQPTFAMVGSDLTGETVKIPYILVVEDNLSLGHLLYEIFRLSGSRCSIIRSKGSAERFLKQVRPNLVVLDYQLIGGIGLEAAKIARDRKGAGDHYFRSSGHLRPGERSWIFLSEKTLHAYGAIGADLDASRR